MSIELDILVRHEQWANAHVVQQMLAQPELPEKSVRLMCHIIGAQHIWISRIQHTPTHYDVFPSIDKHLWLSEIEKNSTVFSQILASDGLDRIVSYKNTKGMEFQNTVREILLHLCLHAQYHRGQIVVHNKSIIPDPKLTDMIFFLRENP
jgi:uncharacterized damage-inducible protein DinB